MNHMGSLNAVARNCAHARNQTPIVHPVAQRSENFSLSRALLAFHIYVEGRKKIDNVVDSSETVFI